MDWVVMIQDNFPISRSFNVITPAKFPLLRKVMFVAFGDQDLDVFGGVLHLITLAGPETDLKSLQAHRFLSKGWYLTGSGGLSTVLAQ